VKGVTRKVRGVTRKIHQRLKISLKIKYRLYFSFLKSHSTTILN